MSSYKLIRIGALHSGRIGHFTANTELYLCEKDHRMHPSNSFDIFGYTDVCNSQLLKMWMRVLNVKRYANLLYAIFSHFPNKDKYLATSIKSKGNAGDRDILGLFKNIQPIFLSHMMREKKQRNA